MYSLYTMVWPVVLVFMRNTLGVVLFGMKPISTAVLILNVEATLYFLFITATILLLIRTFISSVLQALKAHPSVLVAVFYAFRRFSKWNFGHALANNCVKVVLHLSCMAPGSYIFTMKARNAMCDSNDTTQVETSMLPYIIVASIAATGLLGDYQLSRIGKVLPLLTFVLYFFSITAMAVLGGNSVASSLHVALMSAVGSSRKAVLLAIINVRLRARACAHLYVHTRPRQCYHVAQAPAPLSHPPAFSRTRKHTHEHLRARALSLSLSLSLSHSCVHKETAFPSVPKHQSARPEPSVSSISCFPHHSHPRTWGPWQAVQLFGLLGLEMLIRHIKDCPIRKRHAMEVQWTANSCAPNKQYPCWEMIWWVCDIALDDLLEATGTVAADNRRPHQWLEQVTPSKAFCEFMLAFSVRHAIKIGLFTGVAYSLLLHTAPVVLVVVCICTFIRVFLYYYWGPRLSVHLEDRWDILFGDLSTSWRDQFVMLRRRESWKLVVQWLQPRPRFDIEAGSDENKPEVVVMFDEPWVMAADGYFVQWKPLGAKKSEWSNELTLSKKDFERGSRRLSIKDGLQWATIYDVQVGFHEGEAKGPCDRRTVKTGPTFSVSPASTELTVSLQSGIKAWQEFEAEVCMYSTVYTIPYVASPFDDRGHCLVGNLRPSTVYMIRISCKDEEHNIHTESKRIKTKEPPTPPKIKAIGNGPTSLIFAFADEQDEEIRHTETWLVQHRAMPTGLASFLPSLRSPKWDATRFDEHGNCTVLQLTPSTTYVYRVQHQSGYSVSGTATIKTERGSVLHPNDSDPPLPGSRRRTLSGPAGFQSIREDDLATIPQPPAHHRTHSMGPSDESSLHGSELVRPEPIPPAGESSAVAADGTHAKSGIQIMDMLRSEYKGAVLAAEAADAVWHTVAQLGTLSRSATQHMSTLVSPRSQPPPRPHRGRDRPETPFERADSPDGIEDLELDADPDPDPDPDMDGHGAVGADGHASPNGADAGAEPGSAHATGGNAAVATIHGLDDDVLAPSTPPLADVNSSTFSTGRFAGGGPDATGAFTPARLRFATEEDAGGNRNRNRNRNRNDDDDDDDDDEDDASDNNDAREPSFSAGAGKAESPIDIAPGAGARAGASDDGADCADADADGTTRDKPLPPPLFKGVGRPRPGSVSAPSTPNILLDSRTPAHRKESTRGLSTSAWEVAASLGGISRSFFSGKYC